MTANGRRVTGLAALVAGLGALAVAAVLALQPARAPADTGALPVAAPPAASPSQVPSSSPSRSARKAAPLPDSWTPTRVAIGKLDVAAPVVAVGVTRDGALDVPADPSRVGWWIGSARPGDRRGTVLLAGHVDTAEDGKGALFRLENLPMGATIAVRAGDRTVTYRATARRSYPKSRLPDNLFRRDTAPQLALVTCGGGFRNGAYDHNVVVYATPV